MLIKGKLIKENEQENSILTELNHYQLGLITDEPLLVLKKSTFLLSRNSVYTPIELK